MDGPAFYDDAAVLACYRAGDRGATAPNRHSSCRTSSISADAGRRVVDRRLAANGRTRSGGPLAFHYAADTAGPLRRIATALAPGGRLVFSVEHPVITAHDPRSSTDQPRDTWIVDRYFESGARDSEWLGGSVRKYHRTIGDYVDAVTGSGLILAGVREGRPRRDQFASADEYLRRMRIPLFLIVAARVP